MNDDYWNAISNVAGLLENEGCGARANALRNEIKNGSSSALEILGLVGVHLDRQMASPESLSDATRAALHDLQAMIDKA